MDPDTVAIAVALKEYGIPGLLLGYFLYKDFRFTEKVTGLMAKMDAYLDKQTKPA